MKGGITLKIKYNEKKKGAVAPYFRDKLRFEEGEIVYCFLENGFKRGKIEKINGETIEIKIKRKLMVFNLFDEKILRPEDLLILIKDPIFLEGWLGKIKFKNPSFAENFQESIKKLRFQNPS